MYSVFKYRIYIVVEIKTNFEYQCHRHQNNDNNDNNYNTKCETNKMNCELMLTYDTPALDTPALRQTGSRNLTGQPTLPTIWGTYMKLVTKYQISAINSC